MYLQVGSGFPMVSPVYVLYDPSWPRVSDSMYPGALQAFWRRVTFAISLVACWPELLRRGLPALLTLPRAASWRSPSIRRNLVNLRLIASFKLMVIWACSMYTHPFGNIQSSCLCSSIGHGRKRGTFQQCQPFENFETPCCHYFVIQTPSRCHLYWAKRAKPSTAWVQLGLDEASFTKAHWTAF